MGVKMWDTPVLSAVVVLVPTVGCKEELLPDQLSCFMTVKMIHFC